MNEQQPLELFVSCLAGLEGLLAEEMKQLGVRRARPLSGGVAAYSDVCSALRLCLWSRLASRVFVVVGRVDARDADELYKGVRSLVWHEAIASGASIAVQAHGTNNELRNTRFSALKVKDAICDNLRDVRGMRPDANTKQPDALIDVRVRNERATLSLDLAGSSLYQRTYLTPDDGSEAPLECARSAGLLALAGFTQVDAGGAYLVDPACGTGAVVLEAASVALDLAPALLRDRWGFFGWKDFDERIWSDLLEEADNRFEQGLAAVRNERADDTSTSAWPELSLVRIAGCSASSSAVARARERAKRVGLHQVVAFERTNTEDVCAFAERMAAAVHAQGGDNPYFIASVLEVRQRACKAHVQADTTAFIAAAQTAPVGCTFAVVGDTFVEDCFGVVPSCRLSIGQDRVACEALVFDEPPAACASITVPDPAGGTEHTVEVLEQTSTQFASRLIKVARGRRKWARREGITCYRIYDADLPDYAVALDLYTGAGAAQGSTYLHVAEYAPPASVDPRAARRRFNDVLTVAPVVLGVRPDHVFAKTRRRDKGGSQYRDMGKRSFVTQVQEGGYLFEVDLSSYVDTGLFLDHRLTRKRIGEKASGTRFLNLFAYTGSATVYAAGGGAVETTTVDLSQTYLDWARRNMAANGFTGSKHTFERGDVMRWMTACYRTTRRFDLIFVDPPTFSNSKAMGKRTWDVQRDHVTLLRGVVDLLAKGGQAFFSCNLRSFKPDLDSLARCGVGIEDISAQTIPHDFERNPRIHTCYRVWKADRL